MSHSDETPPEPPPRQGLVRSFAVAFHGIALLLRGRNALIQLACGVVAVGLAVWLSISPMEWAILAVTIAMVLAGEAFNSAVEHTVDLAEPNHNPKAKAAKDLGAAAVLILAIGSLGVGAAIFVPKILALW